MKFWTLTYAAAIFSIAVGFTLQESSAARAAECSSATTQAAINACENTAAKAADGALSAMYASVVHAMPQSRRASLAAAQTAWRQYRAKECTFEASAYAGGSLMPAAADACYASVTAARTTQLKALLTQLKSG